MNELNEVQLDIIQGQDYEQEFDYLTDAGVVIDMLTTYSNVQVHFKTNFDDDAPLFTLQDGGANPGVIRAAASPNLKLVFRAAVTNALAVRRGVYDVLLKNAAGKYERAWQGVWTLNRQVTANY